MDLRVWCAVNNFQDGPELKEAVFFFTSYTVY